MHTTWGSYHCALSFSKSEAFIAPSIFCHTEALRGEANVVSHTPEGQRCARQKQVLHDATMEVDNYAYSIGTYWVCMCARSWSDICGDFPFRFPPTGSTTQGEKNLEGVLCRGVFA
jgi:hypothetical protein